MQLHKSLRCLLSIVRQEASTILSGEGLISGETFCFVFSDLFLGNSRNLRTKYIPIVDFKGSGEIPINIHRRPDGLSKAWSTWVSFRGTIWDLFLCHSKKSQWEPTTQHNQLESVAGGLADSARLYCSRTKLGRRRGKLTTCFFPSFFFLTFKNQLDTC